MVSANVAFADLVVTMNVRGTGSGTYEVFMAVDANDPDNGVNAGIASYSIPLSGVDTVDHVSPTNPAALNSATFGVGAIGFGGFGRSSADDPTLTASQDTISGNGMIVYNMGISGGDGLTGAGPAPSNVFAPWVQQSYEAPLLVATGTWSGSTPSFLSGLSINLFDQLQDESTFAATAIRSEVLTAAIPEPSAFAFVALASVLGLSLRRKRQLTCSV